MAERYSVATDGEAWVLSDRETGSQARVVAAWGNNVTQFTTTPPGRPAPIDVIIPAPTREALGANGYGAGIPILFPFPNRVAGGTYTFEGRTYQLDVNEPGRHNHIHGLVCNRPWRVVETGASSQEGAWQRATITLADDPEAVRQFPFPCRLTVTTRLVEGMLVQETEVENTGSGRLPMGYGTHGWFPATLGAGGREATQVRIPAGQFWRLEHLLPTGERVSVEREAAKYDLRAWRALDAQDYDDVFTALERRPDGWTEASIRYPDAGLELAVQASPAFREWVLYAPRARPVICLEPYTCTTNAVNLQPQGIDAGLVVLEPGGSWIGIIRTFLRPATGTP